MARKGANGRIKGASFELRISKELVEAAGPPITRKDCYRTPLSGGHPFGDQGDLVVSPAFRLLFPFIGECKHYRNWHPGVMFVPRQQEKDWMKQAKLAAKRSRTGQIPMLIMSGNLTGVYAAAPLKALRNWWPDIGRQTGCLYFNDDAVRWCMVPWSQVLLAVQNLAAHQREKDQVGITKTGGRKK